MTFDEWWKANSYKFAQADYAASDYEEVARAAWDAAMKSSPDSTTTA